MVTAIGFLLSFLLARGRKPEYAVMRMLGESRLQITLKALLEQFVLCLGGVVLGAAAVMLLAQDSFRPSICAAILLCYTLGAAAAVDADRPRECNGHSAGQRVGSLGFYGTKERCKCTIKYLSDN